MNDLIIYGAGGLGRELLEIIEEINKERRMWRILGFADDRAEGAVSVCGYPVLGGFDFFRSAARGAAVVIGFAASAAKEAAYNKIKGLGRDFYFPAIVHQSSYISPRASLAEGVVIARFCSVNVNSGIGKCALISNKCEISHEAVIGDFASVMPSVNISGNVTVGKRAFIGVQAAILQGITVGSDSVVGMGSVVLTDVPDGCTALGNPAKTITRRADGEN